MSGLHLTAVCPLMAMKPSLISVASTGHVVLLELRISRSQTSAYRQSRREDKTSANMKENIREKKNKDFKLKFIIKYDTHPIFMQQCQCLAAILWVLIIILRNEGAPDESAVGVQRCVFRSSDVYNHFFSNGHS